MTAFVMACGFFMAISSVCAALGGMGYLDYPSMVWLLTVANYSFILQSVTRVLAFSLKPQDKPAPAAT